MADSTNPFAAFAELTLSFLEDTLGVIYIGYVFAAVGFGFTFFQSYFYYTRYSKDHWLTQATVVVLCTLDTAMSCLSSHMLYYYLVTLFVQPVGPEEATSSFCAEVMLSAMAIAIVQCFYGVRIWQVSRSAVLPAAIIGIAIAGAGLGVASGVLMLHNSLFANFSEHYMLVVIAAGQGLRLLAGVMASAGVIAYGAKPAGSGKPSVVWDPITNLLSTGTAGAIAQLLCLVTFVAMPKKYIWIIFHFLSSRIFINGLLLMLNSRAESRGRGIYEEETRITGRGITPVNQTKPNVSDILNQRSMTNHTLNIEVSRVINTDSDSKHYDHDLDSHSLNNDKVKDHPYAL